MTEADIINLNRDPHRAIQELLPWYVTDALDAEEKAMVAAHLEGCAECSAELQADRALGAMMAQVAPSEADRGWAALKARIERPPAARRGGIWRRPSAPARRGPGAAGVFAGRAGGWAVGANAASLMLIASFAWVWAHPQHAQYHALSARKADTTGNVVVIFKPTTSEQDMRTMLRSAKARLVDGPTASDAYVLHVAETDRAATLSQLRASTQVILAEPIDGDGHR
jgi:hypothetical protein